MKCNLSAVQVAGDQKDRDGHHSIPGSNRAETLAMFEQDESQLARRLEHGYPATGVLLPESRF